MIFCIGMFFELALAVSGFETGHIFSHQPDWLESQGWDLMRRIEIWLDLHGM